MEKHPSQHELDNSPRLPFDVLWDIVRIANEDPKPDFRALCALGSLSRALCREAHKRVYRDLLIHNSHEHGCRQPEGFYPRPYANEFGVNWEDLRDIVETCPWIPEYVHSVRLRWDYDVATLDKDAVDMISRFNNVERLTIGRHETYHPMNWSKLAPHILDGWTTLLKLPSITSLRLSSIRDIPPQVLLLCERLTCLTLDCDSSLAEFSTNENEPVEKSIKLKRLRSTIWIRYIMPLFELRGPTNDMRYIDVRALTHLDLSSSDWDPDLGTILQALVNLMELRLDTWHNLDECGDYHSFEILLMLPEIHPPLQNKLRRLSLRYRLDRESRAYLTPGCLLFDRFPPESPELQILEITLILLLSHKSHDWFLEDIANLDKHFLPESPISFPKLSTFKLAVTVLYESPRGIYRPALTANDIVKRLPRAAARQGFLDVSVDFALSETQIRVDNDPSSDEDDELSDF